MRSMVEGLAGAMVQDMSDDCIRIVHDLGGGYPEHAKAFPLEPGVSSKIACRIVAHVVSDAINLDREPGGCTVEIEDITAGGMLAAELESARSLPK